MVYKGGVVGCVIFSLKKEKILPCATTWRNLEDDISETQTLPHLEVGPKSQIGGCRGRRVLLGLVWGTWRCGSEGTESQLCRRQKFCGSYVPHGNSS